MQNHPDVVAAEYVAKAAERLYSMPRWLRNWYNFKKKLLQLLGGLIMEKDSATGDYVVSIGRVAWWIAFLPAVGIWISGRGSLDAGEAIKDISPNHFNILLVLAGYNFGKKVADLANNFVTSKKNTSATVTTTTTTVTDESDGPG